MKSEKLSTGRVKAARPHLLRLVYCLFIFSFVLPYVDVVGCSTKKLSTYRGFDLITGTPAVFYLIAMALFIAMIAFSFFRKEPSRSLGAFGSAWRAMASAAAGFIIGFLPGIQFLFDNVYMLAGQLLGIACTAIVFMDGTAVSIGNYVALRKETPRVPGATALPMVLSKVHWVALIFSLALVPLYGYSLRGEAMIAVMYFIFLSIPFVLSQLIVLQGVKRGERWTLRWAPAVWLFLAGVAVLTVISLF
ncbi:MAG: hypothetical protein KA369_24090 [Spirochaetes bacterium]|nr:hypothetical protein [Spirochaetota bacterium]